MKRIPLAARLLPHYTKGEERFNAVSHIVGGGLSVVVLVLGIVFSALFRGAFSVVSACIYGASLVLLYSVSSVYHALTHEGAKKVLQILDHCAIYVLIAGSYTPILLCKLRFVAPALSWTLFGVIWGFCALAITLNAIDLKGFRVFSMICYLGMGWCIVFAARPLFAALSPTALWLLLAGGIAYTVGAILYGLGTKIPYMHSVFHLFVVLGSALHAVCILGFVL